MSRPNIRRSLRLERLESRELLSSSSPSNDQQYMLYLVNQARTNPAEMAQRVTSNLDANVTATVNYYNVNLPSVKNAIAASPAQPPLAWNDELASAAAGHSQDMADNQFQSHTGSNGSSTEDRLGAAGYNNRSTDGENAYAYATSIDEAMEAFLIDWGVSSNGHRNNLLQPSTAADNAYRDTGIGIVKSANSKMGPLVITQDFGAQQGEKAQLLGVAYNDPNGDHFYEPGEGQEGVTVQAVNQATGQTTSVQTWSSGGYQMPLDPGSYTVTASKDNQVIRSQNVAVGSVNVEVDYDLSDQWQGGTVASHDSSAAAPAVIAPNTTSSNNSAPAAPPSHDSQPAPTPTAAPAVKSSPVSPPNNNPPAPPSNANANAKSNNSSAPIAIPQPNVTVNFRDKNSSWTGTWSSWYAATS